MITGGVKVTGTIYAWNGGDGIHVKGDRSDNSQLQIKGGIDNADTIYALNGEGAAIRVNDATVGHINNSGKLITYIAGKDATDTEAAIPDLMGDQGLYVGSSNIGSHITNAADGEIISNGAGIEIDGSTVGSGKVGDGIFNAGNITADADGISVYLSTVNGDIVNSGNIITGDDGIDVDSSTVKGDIVNSGNITSNSDGVYLSGNDLEDESGLSVGFRAIMSLLAAGPCSRRVMFCRA